MAATPLLQHNWAVTVTDGSGAKVVGDAQTILGSNEFKQSIVVPAGATAEVDCGSVPFAKMVSLYLTSNVAVTVNTNASDATGGQSIALAANKGYLWNNTMPVACPITANITKIFVINAGVKDSTFTASFLLNELV